MIKPYYVETEDDHAIPEGYGIDVSHDGGFYPYIIDADDETNIFYLPDNNGYDMRFMSYADALTYIQERAEREDEQE